jgi:hypothetical protein
MQNASVWCGLQRRLARTEVNANDLALRVLVGWESISTAVGTTTFRWWPTHIYCPNSCPCTDIEAMLWILNRRKVELAGIGQAQHVVLQIQSIRFALQVVRTVLAKKLAA